MQHAGVSRKLKGQAKRVKARELRDASLNDLLTHLLPLLLVQLRPRGCRSSPLVFGRRIERHNSILRGGDVVQGQNNAAQNAEEMNYCHSSAAA